MSKFLPGRAIKSSPWIAALMILIALLVFIPAINEYRSSRNDLLDIFIEQGNMVSEILLRSGERMLALDEEARSFLQDRLLSEAAFIRQLDSINAQNSRPVEMYAAQRMHGHIIFIDTNGNIKAGRRGSRMRFLHPVLRDSLHSFTAAADTAKFVLKNVMNPAGMPGMIIIIQRSGSRGYMIVMPRPGLFDRFQDRRGLNNWLQNLAESQSIRYVVLMQGSKLLAHGGRGFQDQRPPPPLQPRAVTWHTFEHNHEKIFEYVRGEPGGLTIRVGLSGEALDHLQSNLIQRLLISSFLLLALGSILVVFISGRHNYAIINRELKRVQSFSGSILEHMDEGIIVLNQKNEITVFNRAAAYLFNLDNPPEATMRIDQVRLPLDQDVLNLIESKKPLHDLNTAISTEKEQHRHLLISANRIHLETHEDAGIPEELYIILLRDHTTQIELEQFRNRRSKLLAMGELASRVAHEIRNPLNGIGVLAQRIRREYRPGRDATEFDQMTQAIRQETSRINDIIESFLAYARSPQLHPEPLDLKDWLQNMQTILHSLGNVQILPLPEQPCMVKGDQNQLSQALMNLVQNGLEAGAAGEPVSIRLEKSESAIRLLIENKGPVIPEDIREKIFDLYFTTKEKGSGLGLSIVEKIISAHNGRVWPESPPENKNVGSRFIIELPAL